MNIKTLTIIIALSALTSGTISYLMVSKSAPATSNIKQELTQLIESNPELIIDGLRKAQMAKAQKEEGASSEKAKELRPKLESSTTDGQAGNKEGDVTMVAFIDYNCGYCRKSEPDIEKLLSEDTNLKFVMKDFPILGEFSVEKSKASIAIARIAPEKWYAFYKDMNHANTQTVEQVIELAQSKHGIDPIRLKNEMESKETQDKLSENRSLGEQLSISGTPVFIVNGNMIRGAAGYDAFKAAVTKVRQGK
jgi:protein-disulfide isomerase